MTQPTENSTTQAAPSILARYSKYKTGAHTAARSLDRSVLSSARTARRAGSAPLPAYGKDNSLGALAAEVSAIQFDLAGLAAEYDKLNVNITNLIGKDSFLTFGDTMKILGYTMILDPKNATKVKIAAAVRHNQTLETLVNKMGEILSDRYQKAIDGKGKVRQVMSENITNMMRLDRKLITGLRESYIGDQNYAAYEKAIAELESDLAEVQGGLTELETKTKASRAAGNLPEVIHYTDEMSQLLDIKQGILEGKLAKEGEYSDERRKVLDSVVGIQSAKENMAVARVHYQQLNFLLDSYTEQEVKYKHALEDSLVSWKTSAQVALFNQELLGNKKFLDDLRLAGQRLLKVTSALSHHTGEATFELLQTEMFNVEEANALAQDLHDKYVDLQQRKQEWTETLQSVQDPVISSHYAKHE